MTKPVLAFVEIVEMPQVNSLHICPHWAGVDRPYTGGYSLPKDKMALALRLKAAIESGKAWIKEPVVMRDVYDKTYVSAGLNIRMRNCNADLKKLGF